MGFPPAIIPRTYQINHRNVLDSLSTTNLNSGLVCRLAAWQAQITGGIAFRHHIPRPSRVLRTWY